MTLAVELVALGAEFVVFGVELVTLGVLFGVELVTLVAGGGAVAPERGAGAMVAGLEPAIPVELGAAPLELDPAPLESEGRELAVGSEGGGRTSTVVFC